MPCLGHFLDFKANTRAVFTLEDKQIIWTDQWSQTDKSSVVKMGRTNFQTTLLSEFVCLFVQLLRQIFEDDLADQKNKV